MIKFKFRFSVFSKKNSISTLTIIVLSILIVIFEVPFLSRNISNIAVYGLISLFLILNINMFFYIDDIEKKSIGLVLLYLTYIAIFKFCGVSSAAFSYYSTTVKFFFIFIAFILVYKYLTENQKKFIFTVIVIIILYVLVDNIELFIKYGAYSYVYLFQNERFSTNSVNTVFVSSLLLMTGVLFVAFLHVTRRKIKILSLILAIVLVSFSVGIAQRTIFLLLFMIMFPLLVIANANHAKNRVMGIIILIVIVFILAFNYKFIFNWLGEFSGSERIQKRIGQLLEIITNGSIESSSGSAVGRITLMQRSIKTLFSSPKAFLFGSGDHRFSYDVIGNHSQLLDEYARYGIIGGTVVILMFYTFFKCLVRNVGLYKDGVIYSQFYIIYFIFVVRGLLGNVFEPTISIQLVILLPIVFDYIICNKKTAVMGVY